MRETIDEAIGRESKRLNLDKENSDQKEEQLASLFGQNHTPNPQYAPESLGIDPEQQICHEIICKAFVFEKNRTARIPVSGVERYGAPKLWSGVLHGVMQGGAIMDSQHQICFEFQARSWGWGLGWGERRNKGKLGVN